MEHKSEWNSWRAMKDRCRHYQLYLDRGISYAPNWESFRGFLADMGEKPGENFYLSRRDDSVGFCKENCFWKYSVPKGLIKKYRPEYNTWNLMWTRCTNPSFHLWKRYGGRGITICPQWKQFEVFIKDMGECPKQLSKSGQRREYSLDRIDNDGDYCPENCRWATQREQILNSTKSFGKKVHFWDLEGSRVSRTTIYRRLKQGWTKKDALKGIPQEYGALNRRPVRCVETGETFKSIAEAGRSVGANASNISAAVHHRGQNKAAGYHWEFV